MTTARRRRSACADDGTYRRYDGVRAAAGLRQRARPRPPAAGGGARRPARALTRIRQLAVADAGARRPGTRLTSAWPTRARGRRVRPLHGPVRCRRGCRDGSAGWSARRHVRPAVNADRLTRWTAVAAVARGRRGRRVDQLPARRRDRHRARRDRARSAAGTRWSSTALIVAASMVLLDAARHREPRAAAGVVAARRRHRRRRWPRNVLAGVPSGWLGAHRRRVARARAFVGCYELLG